MKNLLWIGLLVLSCNKPAEKRANWLSGIMLTDLQGNSVPFNAVAINQPTVVVFLSPECPICIGYATTLRTLWNDYRTKNIRIAGVIPGNGFSPEVIREYQHTYKIPFELLVDSDYKMTGILGATVTPQCFLFDKNGTVVYKGKIDNYAVAPGVKRQQVTEHYLRDALDAILENKKIEITTTEPAGCFINAN